MKRIIHKLKIAEISAVDRPAAKHARAAIMKRDETGDDNMSDKFTKAEANAAWDTARDAYIKRHGLSFSQGVQEFSVTDEGRRLYEKVLRAPHGPPIAKQARSLSKAEQVIGTMDVTLEVLAKSAHPQDRLPTAIAKFLASPAGRKFYSDYLEEKANVGVR